MLNFRKLISPDYLFKVNSVLLTRSDYWYLQLGAVLTLLAIIFQIAARFSPTPIDKKYRQKLANLLFTVGIGEMVWFGFRVQAINFFGTHLLALLFLLIGLIWFLFIAVKLIRHYREEMAEYKKQQLKLKYLVPNK